MANSSSNLTSVSSSQSQKEVTVNGLFDAASPATGFGRNAATSSGLTWGYYGGTVMVDGAPTQVGNSTLALTANTTNYVERTRAGVVSSNTTGFTAGRIPLYTVVTGASTVSSYTDWRSTEIPSPCGIVAKTITTADVTLTANEARNQIITLSGTLTGNRNLIVPNDPGIWIVKNGTGGAFTVTVKTSAGSGIVIAQGTTAIVYSDGTNVLRATADA
jgi:hypothetical protein